MIGRRCCCGDCCKCCKREIDSVYFNFNSLDGPYYNPIYYTHFDPSPGTITSIDKIDLGLFQDWSGTDYFMDDTKPMCNSNGYIPPFTIYQTSTYGLTADCFLRTAQRTINNLADSGYYIFIPISISEDSRYFDDGEAWDYNSFSRKFIISTQLTYTYFIVKNGVLNIGGSEIWRGNGCHVVTFASLNTELYTYFRSSMFLIPQAFMSQRHNAYYVFTPQAITDRNCCFSFTNSTDNVIYSIKNSITQIDGTGPFGGIGNIIDTPYDTYDYYFHSLYGIAADIGPQNPIEINVGINCV